MADITNRPQVGWDQDLCTRSDGEDGDDGSNCGTKGYQWNRTFIGLLVLCNNQGTQVDKATDQCANCEQDQAQVEARVCTHRHV